MKKILVLGAGGFIGTNLVNYLKDQGHWVCGIDRKKPEYSANRADLFFLADLTEPSTYNKCVQEEFDEIYQLAAEMGGAEYVFTGLHDSQIMSNNVMINLFLLEHLRSTNSKARVLYSSSACLYPKHNQQDPNNPNCSEESAYPADPDCEYGWEKLFSERLYLAYAKNFGTNVRIARYHNTYGPLGVYQGGREKSPAAICRKVITSTGEIEIFGTGEQTRSFLYIDDCLDATVKLMRSDITFPINIGSTEMVTINKLVDIASSIEGKQLVKKHIDGPIGVPGRNSNNTLIEKHLGWKPEYTLEQGIAKTYEWIKSRIDGTT